MSATDHTALVTCMRCGNEGPVPTAWWPKPDDLWLCRDCVEDSKTHVAYEKAMRDPRPVRDA